MAAYATGFGASFYTGVLYPAFFKHYRIREVIKGDVGNRRRNTEVNGSRRTSFSWNTGYLHMEKGVDNQSDPPKIVYSGCGCCLLFLHLHIPFFVQLFANCHISNDAIPRPIILRLAMPIWFVHGFDHLAPKSC